MQCEVPNGLRILYVREIALLSASKYGHLHFEKASVLTEALGILMRSTFLQRNKATSSVPLMQHLKTSLKSFKSSCCDLTLTSHAASQQFKNEFF